MKIFIFVIIHNWYILPCTSKYIVVGYGYNTTSRLNGTTNVSYKQISHTSLPDPSLSPPPTKTPSTWTSSGLLPPHLPVSSHPSRDPSGLPVSSETVTPPLGNLPKLLSRQSQLNFLRIIYVYYFDKMSRLSPEPMTNFYYYYFLSLNGTKYIQSVIGFTKGKSFSK